MFTERAHFEFSHGLLPRSSSEPKRVSQGFSHGWPQARAHAYMYKLVELEVAQAVTAAQISSHAICFKITGFVFLTDLVVFGHRIAQKLQKKKHSTHRDSIFFCVISGNITACQTSIYIHHCKTITRPNQGSEGAVPIGSGGPALNIVGQLYFHVRMP